MSKPCAFCENRADCRAEHLSCALWRGSDVEYVKYEPYGGRMEEVEDEED